MPKDTQTVERLLELLEQKDRELREAQSEADSLKRTISLGVDWMLQERNLSKNDLVLPFPRIQVDIHIDPDFHSISNRSFIVFQERWGGDEFKAPLGASKGTGRYSELLALSTDQRIQELPKDAKIMFPSIVDDACFYSEKSGLPLYISANGRYFRVEQLRPALRMKAVHFDEDTCEPGCLQSRTEA